MKHARYCWLLLAEGHVKRNLFGEMLRRIWALPSAGSLKPTARKAQRTWVAEGRRKGSVAQEPCAVAGTARSGSIQRPEWQRKGYRTWQQCEERCIAAVDRLLYVCQDGQKRNSSLDRMTLAA